MYIFKYTVVCVLVLYFLSVFDNLFLCVSAVCLWSVFSYCLPVFDSLSLCVSVFRPCIVLCISVIWVLSVHVVMLGYIAVSVFFTSLSVCVKEVVSIFSAFCSVSLCLYCLFVT